MVVYVISVGLSGVLVVVVIGLSLVVAVAGHSWDVGWLLEMKTVEGEVEDVAKALAPVMALALVIERLIEAAFDLFEQSIGNVGKLAGAGEETVDWFKRSIDKLWSTLDKQKGKADDVRLVGLQEVQREILMINQLIVGLIQAPKYVAFKRSASIVASFTLGFVVAILADVGIVACLGMALPRIFDMLLTGLVIGAGTGPLHSLTGILQGAKDALDALKKPALSEAADELLSDPQFHQAVGGLQKELAAIQQQLVALREKIPGQGPSS